ncbi:hypothetical protein MKW92_001259 [Papaver armeniacum]|nr:hypothetical protein MKW92_001259 [Papaver armeniacum]
MVPSMYPKKMKLDNVGTLPLTQTWHKYGTCPQGSIPVRRVGKTLLHKHSHLKLPQYKTSPHALQPNEFGNGHEYATIQVNGNFLGAQAKINLWNPVIEIPSEFSVSQIWVAAGDGDDFNSIEAGWEVDGYKSKSCFNLECGAFVHTSSEIALGCNFTEVSTFKGDQKDATFGIHKDQNSGNWWVQVQGIPVGYYPNSLFTQLSKTATKIGFGGEVMYMIQGRHTKTQMGSGHFPSEGGLGISSYFNQVQIIDENNKAKDPENVKKYISNPNCYDLQIDDKHTNGYGFYYGGPGYNDKCQ